MRIEMAGCEGKTFISYGQTLTVFIDGDEYEIDTETSECCNSGSIEYKDLPLEKLCTVVKVDTKNVDDDNFKINVLTDAGAAMTVSGYETGFYGSMSEFYLKRKESK